MPKTKARSGAFQKGADLPAIRQAGVRSNRRQGHVALRPRAQGREAIAPF